MINSPAVRPEAMGLIVDENGKTLPSVRIVDVVKDLANNDHLVYRPFPQQPAGDEADLYFTQLIDMLESESPIRRAAGLCGLGHLAVSGSSDDFLARARILLARNLSSADITSQFSLPVAKGLVAAQAVQAQLSQHQRVRRLSEGVGHEDQADYRKLGEILEYYASLGPEGARGGLSVGDTVLNLEQIQRYAHHMMKRDRTPKPLDDSDFERRVNLSNQDVENAIINDNNILWNNTVYRARQQSVHLPQIDRVSAQLRAEMRSKVTPSLTPIRAFESLRLWIKDSPNPVDATGNPIRSSQVIQSYNKAREKALVAIRKHLEGSAVLEGVSETLPLLWAYANGQSNKISSALLLQALVERLAEIEVERNCIFGQRAIMLQIPLGITINANKVYQFEDIKQDLEKIAFKLMEDANREGEHQYELFRKHRNSIKDTRLNEVLTPYYRGRMKMERFVRVELLLGLGPDLFKTDLENWMVGIESFLDAPAVKPIPLNAQRFDPVVLEKINSKDIKGLMQMAEQSPEALMCRDEHGRGPLELAVLAGWSKSEIEALGIRFNLDHKEKIPKIEYLSVLN